MVNAGTATALVKWCQRWPERQYAIEGAKGLGRGIAQILVARGEYGVDVPSTLAMKVRVLSTGGGRKTDPDDARAVALTAWYHHGLHQVHRENQSTILRLLSECRDDLTREKTRVLNRLHQLLRELIPGGVPIGLSADKAGAAMRRIKPTTAADACRRDLAKDVLADLRRIDSNSKANEAQIRDAVAATTTTLQEIHGINTVLAAKLLGHIGDITRFPSADHFAATPAPLLSPPQAARTHATGSIPVAIANSIPCCTPSPSTKSATQGPAASTTSANSTKARHGPKPGAHSNAASRTPLSLNARDQQHAPPTAAWHTEALSGHTNDPPGPVGPHIRTSHQPVDGAAK